MARRSLKTGREPIITRGKFEMDTAKMFLAAVIICFHILPLLFVIGGDLGKQLLTQVCMVYLNPMFIFVILFLYGVRIGFNFRMPLFSGLIATLSIVMYYQFEDSTYAAASVIIMFIVYMIFSFASSLLGAFVKRFLA